MATAKAIREFIVICCWEPLLVTRLQPGNADPEALPQFLFSPSEAEPLDMGFQASAWEPVNQFS
jgi:hypothetical protein